MTLGEKQRVPFVGTREVAGQPGLWTRLGAIGGRLMKIDRGLGKGEQGPDRPVGKKPFRGLSKVWRGGWMVLVDGDRQISVSQCKRVWDASSELLWLVVGQAAGQGM